MKESTVWINTRAAVKDFMQLLACNKCKERPTEPVRYIDCQHLFCFNCIQQDTNCFVCGVPVGPTDIWHDHITSTLVVGCDNIVNIIFSNGDKETGEGSDLSEEAGFPGFDNLTNISSSTRISKDSVNKEIFYTEKPAVILEESDSSDKTEKIQDSGDETVKLADSDDLENFRSSASSAIKNTAPETRKLKKPACQSQSSSLKGAKKVPKDVNKRNKKGESLLHQACVKKQEETVKMLLGHGANPNTKDHANWTPLQETVKLGLYKICELLLENGALPDTPGIDSRTALHEAAEHGKSKEVALLLHYGANPNVFDQHGKKPIDYCNSEEIRKLLSHDELLNETGEKSFNILSGSLNRSIGSSVTKIVVLASNLNQTTYASLSHLASKHKFKVVNSFASNVTHVVVEADQQFLFNYDLLLSVLHGKWILSSEWIEIGLSPECKDLREMDLDIFEMKCLTYDDTPCRARLNAEKQNPGLFNNCYFYFALNPYETYTVGQISLTKKSLIRLCDEGGGTHLSRQPNPENLQDNRIPFHVAYDERHPLHNCCHFIIYAPGKEEPRMKYNMPHIKTLPLVWFIECIEKFTLVDPALCGII